MTERDFNQPARPRRERIVYVAPDCTDSAVKKRAHGFLQLGHELLTFTFRRDRYNVGACADWPNVEMGKSEERRLGARFVSVLHVVRSFWQHRQVWRDATLICARNLDLAVLTLIGKFLTRAQAPFVFEVLDIHPLLAKRSKKGAILRWIERRVLNRCQLLVVSSPAFVREYFRNWQGFAGNSFLLENKWTPGPGFSDARKLAIVESTNGHGRPRWIIGWFGNLRCPRSLEILLQLADALPEQVGIYLRGCPSLLGSGTLERAIAGRANVRFAGEYSAPEDLAEIYGKVHFNWCGDFSDGENSRWLLPNRVYEGGYFGIPALAVAGHETGQFVKERQLGITVDIPYVEHLRDYFVSLDSNRYAMMRQAIESMPVEQFVDHGELQQLVDTAVGA